MSARPVFLFWVTQRSYTHALMRCRRLENGWGQAFDMRTMKITEYNLVIEHADVIEKKVNEFIKAGWQPFGTPFVLPPADEMLPMNTVFQAMVQIAND